MCPNLNDLSNFVKRADLKGGEHITFMDVGEIREVDFSLSKDGSGLKTVFQIGIKLADGRDKIITLNAGSRHMLSEAWGINTEEWINKVAEITFVKQLAFGKMIDVLVLMPVA